MSSHDYTGLHLVAPTGVVWRWVGHTNLTTRFGAHVRVERWEAPCRACGAPFTVLAKLAGGLRHTFFERRRAWEGSSYPLVVRLSVPAACPVKAFATRNCKAHRGQPAPPGRELL
jgi:hypothetical protein